MAQDHAEAGDGTPAGRADPGAERRPTAPAVEVPGTAAIYTVRARLRARGIGYISAGILLDLILPESIGWGPIRHRSPEDSLDEPILRSGCAGARYGVPITPDSF